MERQIIFGLSSYLARRLPAEILRVTVLFVGGVRKGAMPAYKDGCWFVGYLGKGNAEVLQNNA
jgi:hypothetical protein